MRDNVTSFDDPTPPAGESDVGDGTGAPETVESLRREVARLRDQLARAKAEAAEYRGAAYHYLGRLWPDMPPSLAEAHDLMYGPRGESIADVIAEHERRLGG